MMKWIIKIKQLIQSILIGKVDDTNLYKDKVEASFTIGDTVFFYERDYLRDSEFACPLNGQRLLKFKLPKRISKNQPGILRIKFKQVDYLEDAPNVRVVLFYTDSARKWFV